MLALSIVMEERRRRRLIGLGIALWLGLQIGVPLARKFELPSFRYRYTTYTWAMFSRPSDRKTLDFYRRNASGRREPIPGLDRFVVDILAPAGQPWRMPYRSDAEIDAWITLLVEHIAERSEAGWEYVAVLRARGRPGAGPREREVSAPGRRS